MVFDPSETKIDKADNSKQVHIHPLCVPKVYKYDPIKEKVDIRPANEGGIFSTYSSILEKLKEQPSMFSHTSQFFQTPLKRNTYDSFLKQTDWLIILDQSLKSWDISLRIEVEKLFYKENDYRSVGIYSSNCKKFILGYAVLVKSLGNFIPGEKGLRDVIESVREINNDGLLSIVSHVSNQIFDQKHGKLMMTMKNEPKIYRGTLFNFPTIFYVKKETAPRVFRAVNRSAFYYFSAASDGPDLTMKSGK